MKPTGLRRLIAVGSLSQRVTRGHASTPTPVGELWGVGRGLWPMARSILAYPAYRGGMITAEVDSSLAIKPMAYWEDATNLRNLLNLTLYGGVVVS